MEASSSSYNAIAWSYLQSPSTVPPGTFFASTASQTSDGMGNQILVQTRERAKSSQSRLKIAFWLDVILLISICALPAESFTGLILHEWLGLAMAVMVFAHLLLSWSWIASTSRGLFTERSIRTRINYLLNLSLFAAITATIFSGVLISHHAIPVLTGTKAPSDMDWHWDTLHLRFSFAAALLSGLHLAINWDWVLAAGQKIFRRMGEGSR